MKKKYLIETEEDMLEYLRDFPNFRCKDGDFIEYYFQETRYYFVTCLDMLIRLNLSEEKILNYLNNEQKEFFILFADKVKYYLDNN